MEYQFCPKCGTKADKKAHNLLVCPNCEYNFYINPASTNAIILENSKGEILMVKRKFEPKKGMLDLPGGFIESGETLEESTKREIKEELGIEIEGVKYLSSHPDEYLYQGVNIKTLGFILTGKISDDANIVVSDDVEEAKFYPKDNLPIEEIAFESLKKGLSDYLQKQ